MSSRTDVGRVLKSGAGLEMAAIATEVPAAPVADQLPRRHWPNHQQVGTDVRPA
jgi:hypothetical protein